MTVDDRPAFRCLLLPGWHNSGPLHWQSRWESLHGCERVEQDDWQWPRRGDWMSRLDEVLLEDPRSAVLVAHSLGCQLVAAWAAATRHAARVRAALLVAPADTERADMPPNLHTWRPIARAPLPFPSLVAYSSNDPFASVPRTSRMAHDWGSDLIDLGPRGHVNGESALGDWSEGWSLLNSLLR